MIDYKKKYRNMTIHWKVREELRRVAEEGVQVSFIGKKTHKEMWSGAYRRAHPEGNLSPQIQIVRDNRIYLNDVILHEIGHHRDPTIATADFATKELNADLWVKRWVDRNEFDLGPYRTGRIRDPVNERIKRGYTDVQGKYKALLSPMESIKETVTEAAGPQAFNFWDRFKKSKAGNLWTPLSMKKKVAIGIGASIVALGMIRSVWRMLQPDMQPPPAFQGSYGTLEGMSKSGMAPVMRKQYTDFGSPVRLNRAANKPILGHRSPSRNMSRQHTGFVQGLV